MRDKQTIAKPNVTKYMGDKSFVTARKREIEIITIRNKIPSMLFIVILKL